jgi:predicted DsbA family dithiol-disulfide isomerase
MFCTVFTNVSLPYLIVVVNRPWCWVGKRKMETAMAMFPQHTFAVTWQPFLLRPNAPREGVLKAPDTPDNPRVGARMKGAGQAVGIDFTGKCDR